MNAMPFPTTGDLDVAPQEVAQRLYRYHVPSLVYIHIDQGNGGIVRDISIDGLGIQAVGRLHPGQAVLARFDLLNPRARIEASAEVVWSNDSGQAGLRFTGFPDRTRRSLKDWIFTNMLASMDHITTAMPMFQPAAGVPERPVLSGFLPVNPPRPEPDSEPLAISLPFWPAPVSMRTVWLLMDGLLVLSAVLLFWVVFLALARSLPSWPVTLGVAAGIAVACAFVYRLLFRTFALETPGCYLATRAAAEETLDKVRGMEPATRFR
jgi:hypothetical protein